MNHYATALRKLSLHIEFNNLDDLLSHMMIISERIRQAQQHSMALKTEYTTVCSNVIHTLAFHKRKVKELTKEASDSELTAAYELGMSTATLN